MQNLQKLQYSQKLGLSLLLLLSILTQVVALNAVVNHTKLFTRNGIRLTSSPLLPIQDTSITNPDTQTQTQPIETKNENTQATAPQNAQAQTNEVAVQQPASSPGNSGEAENIPGESGGSYYDIATWNDTLRKTIHADVTQSTRLPDGRVLWVFGDTTEINGTSVVGRYGYPHSAFVIQNPDSLVFSAVSTPFLYKWQPVPNWSDGTYFWMSAPFVDGNTLYVTGQRIKGFSPFTIIGEYIASFDATTLEYKTLTEIPTTTTTASWSGVAKISGGWQLAGTRKVTCSYATNCNVGDMAFIPDGNILNFKKWQVTRDVIPASENLGVGLALIKHANGWTIFNKRGGMYGGTEIQRLNASSILGPWAQTYRWPISGPGSTYTYAVAVHTSQSSPSDQALVSYNVSGGNDTYYARFMYLPLR